MLRRLKKKVGHLTWCPLFSPPHLWALWACPQRGPPWVRPWLASWTTCAQMITFQSSCVFPQWGAHLRIAHVTAGSLSLQTQPSRGMLVSSTSSTLLPFALFHPHATVAADTFDMPQLCSNNMAAFLLSHPTGSSNLLWAVISNSNSSEMYITSAANLKFNLYLNRKHPPYWALRTTTQMRSNYISSFT